MMTSKNFVAGCVLVASLAAAGCGDDSEPTTSTVDMATPSTPGADDAGAGTVDDSLDQVPICFDEDALEPSPNPTMDAPSYNCDANPSADPEARNACRNDADCAIIATDLVRATAKDCGLGCLNSSDQDGDGSVCNELLECNTTCVVANTFIYDPNEGGNGLSEGCASCYSDIAACALKFCFMECVDDPDTGDCVLCQLENGCRIPFEKCSGLEQI